MTGPDRGPDILQGGHSPYPPAGEVHGAAVLASPRRRVVKIRKLHRVTRQRLASELTLSPRESGYDEAEWSGALLARHLLLRYGIELGSRHCRRILASFRPMPPSDARKRNQRSTILHLHRDNQLSSGQRLPQPLGSAADMRNKRITLKRIQRLCSAGLPPATLAMTLFDLVGDAIPHSDIRIMTADYADHRWLTNIDISSWAPTFARLLELPPVAQGITMEPRILARKQLWRHEELEVGSFERGAGYNEFARHIGFHHVLSLMLHAPDGRLGNYPIWRSRDMRPFSREDRKFAAAILPHLNHALAIAAVPAAEIIDGENGFSPVAKYDLGLVMIDTDGRILAANRPAQSIFYTLQVFDESSRNASGSTAVGDSLMYIAGILRKIFLASGGPEPDTPAPVTRLMDHPSGYQLRMRGYAANGEASKVFFVAVEAGETADRFAKRIMYRYGLNRTQAELMTLLANRPASPPAELAALLNIRPDTLKKSLRRLADRLDLDNQAVLRELAHSVIANNGTAAMSLPRGLG